MSELRPRPENLEAYLARGHLAFRLTPNPEDVRTPKLAPCTCPCPGHPQGLDWDEIVVSHAHLLADLPAFAFADVEDFRTLKRHRVFAVTINQRTLVYKPAINSASLINEVGMPKQLAVLPSGGALRVPKVEGILGAGTIYAGILMTHIPSTGILDEMIGTGVAVSTTERQQWYNQISDALRIVHRNGYYWGDAHPRNVVIDGNREV
ncbi:hypothetical protein BO79DRAFT_250387 [Aspergillus costaricaensis CBS 115574]|uniref:Uncharacterized protein n=1 Tax=Aspergillus costaricaensis CBS 115574 TaxID=1448317 RepID=A0ACD1IT44_9EURO|nr:hypothetical protein BO79DRAFT_250387 [Aspergillus costaricaensis CBS 115574]RAK93766.1 hypothetical protein BO79DRAFT_250387 [Aspergillus costaricaensis CBS 115574]